MEDPASRRPALGCLIVMGVALQAQTTPSKLKQRSGSVKADVTLGQIQQALADADAKPGDPDAWPQINKLLRSMPDALCPTVAELTLNLKNNTLWKPAVRQASTEWSLFDAAATVKRIETITDPQRKNEAWSVVVQVWRQRDPEACWAYLTSRPDSVARDHDMQRFLESYSYKDPKRTLELAATVKNPTVRKNAIGEVAWHWAEKDAPAALAWVNALPADTQRDELIRRVVLGQTSHNKLSSKEATTLLRKNLYANWSHNNEAAAQAWLTTKPDLSEAEKKECLQQAEFAKGIIFGR